MKKIHDNITQCVGDTPLVRLKSFEPEGAMILGKLESKNPSFSVKDRIARAMIEQAETEGKIHTDTVIVEPTSGNTGIGLAMICAQRGYRLILAMPESMSMERRKLLARYGAEISLTPPEDGMAGAVARAREIAGQIPRSFMPHQFENPANPRVHYLTTGPEIWRDTDGACDIFVAGVGTGGTVSGVGEYLKEQNARIRVFAVEPKDSPVLSGGESGPHRIQGIGAGFVPKNYRNEYVDGVIRISNDDAFETSSILAKKEGILAGISAGANVCAAQMAATEALKHRGSGGNGTSDGAAEIVVVTVICDSGERYLSVW